MSAYNINGSVNVTEDSYAYDIAGMISSEIRKPVSVVVLGSESNCNKRDAQDHLLSWSIDEGNFLRTTPTSLSQLSATIESYDTFASAGGSNVSVSRREYNDYGDTWVSYNAYGYDASVTQDAINEMYYVVEGTSEALGYYVTTTKEYPSGLAEIDSVSKFCLAMAQDAIPGEKSIIVGEIYMGAYGGIDGECQGG